MSRRRAAGTLACLAVLVATAVACGSDEAAAPATTDEAPTDTAVASSTAPTTAAPTTAAPTTEVPATAVPTTAAPTTAAPTTVAPSGDDPAAVWALVFDSEQPFEAKAVHLADAEALRPTVEAYQGAGSGFGGISLEPTDVAVDGETATITYDVNFGANPAYGGQVGTIVLIDGVWTVSRDEFCSFMASARVSCP